jgi:hypothetical protein
VREEEEEEDLLLVVIALAAVRVVGSCEGRKGRLPFGI